MELSSDDYDREIASPKGFERKSDLNFAMKYQLAPDFSIMGQFMHGEIIGLTGILALNPRNSPYKSGLEPAPMPLLSDKAIRKTQYFMDKDIFLRSAELLELDGIALLNLEIKNEFVNTTILDRNYRDVSKWWAVARISRTVPLNVKFFKIEVVDFQTEFSVSQE